jgi:predicted transposase YbfD/YdcC
LVLEGRVIVADAMFCQKDLCQRIRDGSGRYFVVVKDNQPRLKQDIQSAFAETEGFPPPTFSKNMTKTARRMRRSRRTAAG